VKFLFKDGFPLLLQPTIWVLIYFYIKSFDSKIFGERDKKMLIVGLSTFIVGIAGNIFLYTPFIEYVRLELYINMKDMAYYIMAYQFFWNLISSVGLFIFLKVAFSKVKNEV
jgi:hypothetical protein